MRPIDADALKQMIDFRMWDVDDDYPHDEASNRISEDHAVKKIIDEMPTIDAVPVIRCRDCKHGKEDEDGLIECTFWDFMNHTHSNDQNGFCFRAEPKETE